MTLGKFISKASTRALTKKNKAQVMDNASSLSQGGTKAMFELFAKTKTLFKQMYQKKADTLRPQNDAQPSAIVAVPCDFAIPAIDFEPVDLSITTKEPFKTLQQDLVVHPASAGRANAVANSASSASVVESAPVSTISISTNSNVEVGSEFDSASSAQTALSIHSVTPTSEPLIENSPKHQSLPKVPSITTSRHTEPDVPPTSSSKPSVKMVTKGRQQKLVGVLNKLKAKLLYRNNTKDSGIEYIKAETIEDFNEGDGNKEDEDEDFADRCQWDIITKIDRDTILDLVRTTIASFGYHNCVLRITSTTQGTYHFVFIVKTIHRVTKKIQGFVVKIPGHGTPDRWTADDEYMLKREVDVMDLVNVHTEIPSPTVMGHSATLDNNKYGFPYIVMKLLPGKAATGLWFDDHGAIPSPETEEKRLTFLRSLARHMTELNKLPFTQIGIPTYKTDDPDLDDIYDQPELEELPVDKYYVWPFYDSFRSIERGPFASTQAYIQNSRKNEELSSAGPTKKLSFGALQEVGVSKIFDIVFSHPVFQSCPDETFTLRHSDLDAQNILINGAGEVTGILDWDGSISMPRCVGGAAVPHFFERDFYPNAAVNSLILSWRSNHYRSVYAAALVEAGNVDARFTTKSHIYQAGFAALYEGGDRHHFVERLIQMLPDVLMDVDDFKALVGKGCNVTDAMLKEELWKILDPELPREGLLENFELQNKEAKVQVWMDGFDGCFNDHVDDL